MKTKKKQLQVRKHTAVLKHRLFVPAYLVTEEMKEAFTDQIPDYLDPYDQYGEEVLDRTLYLPGWKYHKKLEQISFTRGDVNKINEVFKDFDIVDKTSDVMLKYDIKWKGVLVDGEYKPLYAEQKSAISEMLKHHHGILQAPPRFGKTTVMTRLITKYKRRTIFFSHQIDLIQQFEKEFRRCTNINEIEKQVGKKLIGQATKWEDLEKFEIALVTWQRFHMGKGGKAAQKRFANSFGMTLVDEGHRFSSQFSSKVVGRFNTRFRIAVTATPDRKDQRDVVFKQIVGPVTVIGQTKQVPLRVRILPTGFAPKFTRWTTFVKRLAESQTRNKMCLDLVEKEVKSGKSVLIVTVLRAHISDLVQRLKKRGISAEGFYGGVKDRENLLRRAKSGTTKVVVGMRSMLTGVNVPVWSCIHILQPTANAPSHYQEFSRVRTIHPGKAYATVTHYLDRCGAARGCYKTCHGNYVHPDYQPISFVDKNGNVLAKRPSLNQIYEWSNTAGQKYTEEDEDRIISKGKSGRKPTGFSNGAALWGWSSKYKLGAKRK